MLVPTFDGHTQFQLSKYWENPYTGDHVVKGSTVMLFTVKKGNLPNEVTTALGAPLVKFGAYLNVLGIAVLAIQRGTVPGAPEAFRIDFITEVPEAEGAESKAGDNPFL